MSLLARSARFLGTALKSVAKERIAYARGVNCLTLEAIPGRHENQLDAIEEQQASAREFDWIVCSNELLIDGRKIEPQLGDVITWCDLDGNDRTYHVVQGQLDRCFSVVDQLGILYRIHTVEVTC